jgi:hypothetical protein
MGNLLKGQSTSAIEEPAKRIRRNYEYLVNEFDVSTYLDALYAEEVISFGDMDNLRNEQRKVVRARTFFDLLMTKPEQTIRRFFEILRTREDKQPQIYDRLFGVTCAEHQGVARGEHVQLERDDRSGASASSCASNQEAPSKARSDSEQLLCSRPDLENSFLPTLLLDNLRLLGHLTSEEYRKLQDRLLSESQRSHIILRDILPSKGENSVTDFCDVFDAEEKKRLAIVITSPYDKKKVLRNTEYVPRQQRLVSGHSSSRKRKENFAFTGSKLPKMIQREWIKFFFRPKHRELIQPIECVIGHMCSKHFGIDRGQVEIIYAETAEIDTMLQSWEG